MGESFAISSSATTSSLLWGKARFIGPNEVAIEGRDGNENSLRRLLSFRRRYQPARPESVPFNGQTVFTSDEVMHLIILPKTMIVVGGGVIGTEYACIMATLGVQVTLIEGRNKVLGFLDQEIADAFQYFMRQSGITLRLGERVERIQEVEHQNGSTHRLVEAQLESGKRSACANTALRQSAARASVMTWGSNRSESNSTTANVSKSTLNIRPTSSTSMPRVTSSDFPHSPRPAWSKAAGRSAMLSL